MKHMSHGLALGVGFLLLLIVAVTAQSEKNKTTVVSHLPGFHGPLPFSLETGYVQVDDSNGVRLFYYFVQSERSPAEDPVLLWLTGGPGCSAFSGLVYEIGPLSFQPADSYTGGPPELVANVIFLDSPVGAGFSYSATDQGYKSCDTQAVDQIVIFLTKWYEDHPQFLLNPLFIAGDSYSGLIAPPLTFQIAKGIEMGYKPLLNLKGYIIGNPLTDHKFDLPARVPYAHRMGLISDEQYEVIYRESCGVDTGMNRNIQCKNCHDAIDKEKGYSMSGIWANNMAVRKALGVHKGTVPVWLRCNHGTPYTTDIRSSVEYHRSLTSKGYRSLIYSGDHDMTVPFIGTQAWIRFLGFAVVDEWRPWFTTLYANNLTFATIKGYIIGNPLTDHKFDLPARVPYAHRMGLISDEQYEVTYRESCGAGTSMNRNIQCKNYDTGRNFLLLFYFYLLIDKLIFLVRRFHSASLSIAISTSTSTSQTQFLPVITLLHHKIQSSSSVEKQEQSAVLHSSAPLPPAAPQQTNGRRLGDGGRRGGALLADHGGGGPAVRLSGRAPARPLPGAARGHPPSAILGDMLGSGKATLRLLQLYVPFIVVAVIAVLRGLCSWSAPLAAATSVASSAQKKKA
ncbi:Serine carboxypeptidase-like 17 [Triticum urartu]|uniref:Uncharacterized protein n=2 Tax=Triticum TaxID=4564 RepID=A0A9R0RCV0_TRITD|nr:Serine carboxypeptidase-like 17 [Triticum urartu]VAH57543.1 unnamed protein product [Triticum turgidum subsp. durum]